MRYFMMALLAAVFALASGPAAAQDGNELLNQPSLNWNVYGPGQTHATRKDKNVQGGGAMRIEIAEKPENVWDIGASTTIEKPITKGSKLVFAFWARLVSGGNEGKAEVVATIQGSSAPYPAIATGKVEIGPEWKLVHISGVADADYASGAANAALSLGSAAYTLDLGPAFIMAVT